MHLEELGPHGPAAARRARALVAARLANDQDLYGQALTDILGPIDGDGVATIHMIAWLVRLAALGFHVAAKQLDSSAEELLQIYAAGQEAEAWPSGPGGHPSS